MPRRLPAVVVAVLAVLPTVAGAQPDWKPLQYPDGVGCGLYVQFFTADGWEPIVNGKRVGLFAGSAPPSTSEADCVAKCGEWAASPRVGSLTADYRKKFFVTQVRGTCYLRRQVVGPPRVLEIP